MGYRVVDKSSIVFETDLSPSARIIHPSGVIHAFRTDLASSDSNSADEHLFAWIPNSLLITKILSHLEKNGFHRSREIVFIPFSTKKNWLSRYSHAPLSLECTKEGKVVVLSTEAEASDHEEHTGRGDSDAAVDPGSCKRKKRIYRCRTSMVGDMSLLPDPERDELHIEIFNYLTWLHKRLVEMEEKKRTAVVLETEEDMGREDDEEESERDNDEENGDEAVCKTPRSKEKVRENPDVNVPVLQGALEQLKSAFYVIPNIKNERFRKQVQRGFEEAEPGEDSDAAQRGAPFLEEELGTALARLVEARVLAGWPRRRLRSKTAQKPKPKVFKRKHHAANFEVMLEKLERYYQEHGDCDVGRRAKEYPDLQVWVAGVRDKRRKARRRGIYVDEVGPGRPLTAKMLTAERLERLEAIGFVWEGGPSHTPWEERFRQVMAYHEENGKWPSQSVPKLGEWTHSQRTLYARKDKSFMKDKFTVLDEAGFEWTPKGYFWISWDEGFEKLMEFFQKNGHFDVPCPPYGEGDKDGDLITKKSDAHKLYKWVMSLHAMYRSFKLGRQSGSLTEERISLLMNHGFKFRDR